MSNGFKMGAQEKINSELCRIDISTRELLENLRCVESLTKNINERLLPSIEKELDKENPAAEREPSGWIETHSTDLKVANHKIIKIIEKLEKLDSATKTDVK